MFSQFKNSLLRQVFKKKCHLSSNVLLRQSSSPRPISSLILSNTKLKRSELVPEIALHLMSQELDVWSLPHDDDKKVFTNDPFWAIFWPGGQAVCRYLLDNPNLFSGKNVFILGCGSGAEAVAALRAGAKKPVGCNDIDNLALEAVQLNVQSNGFANTDVHLMSDNLLDVNLERNAKKCSEKFDVLLVGDLFYDEEVGGKVLEFIEIFARSSHEDKKIVCLGDPGRWCLQSLKVKLRCLASYNLPMSIREENNGFTKSHVFTFF